MQAQEIVLTDTLSPSENAFLAAANAVQAKNSATPLTAHEIQALRDQQAAVEARYRADSHPASRNSAHQTQYSAEERWGEFQQEHKGERVDLGCPVDADVVVTSPYGMRPDPFSKAHKLTVHRKLEAHPGIDLAVPHGAPAPQIVAAADGIVLYSGNRDPKGFGPMVIIGHADGTASLYSHLTGSGMPAIGTQVAKGDAIGTMGNRGRSKGTHLLFCVQPDPMGAPGEFIHPVINGASVQKGDNLNGQTSGIEVAANRHIPKEFAHLSSEYTHPHARLHYSTMAAQEPHSGYVPLKPKPPLHRA
jgi:murein DD-endopeptidase MepM/ murein hydrolase activator NlpD